MAADPSVVGLAGLVGLVPRWPGHRRELPAAGPRLDALHRPGARPDGRGRLGLLVLVPWGALGLSRAVGHTPGVQRAAVAVVLVLTAAPAHMHWFLSEFHLRPTFFGSWPAMVAVAVGLHAAAWAARPQRPAACGGLASVALLFNATVVPGVADLPQRTTRLAWAGRRSLRLPLRHAREPHAAGGRHFWYPAKRGGSPRRNRVA